MTIGVDQEWTRSGLGVDKDRTIGVDQELTRSGIGVDQE